MPCPITVTPLGTRTSPVNVPAGQTTVWPLRAPLMAAMGLPVLGAGALGVGAGFTLAVGVGLGVAVGAGVGVVGFLGFRSRAETVRRSERSRERALTCRPRLCLSVRRERRIACLSRWAAEALQASTSATNASSTTVAASRVSLSRTRLRFMRFTRAFVLRTLWRRRDEAFALPDARASLLTFLWRLAALCSNRSGDAVSDAAAAEMGTNRLMTRMPVMTAGDVFNLNTDASSRSQDERGLAGARQCHGRVGATHVGIDS